MQKLKGEIFLVGGAVRDTLLGIPIKERDWLVVGSSIDDMLKAGFHQIDENFPVFLHPETREEYALARREVKVGPGHKGFEFDCAENVTVMEDLKRRDLTINAMAIDKNDNLIDVYGGQRDLKDKRLRHVSDAFSEDPLRIFRVARFAAKLGQQKFRLAHSTHKMMKEMVKNKAIEEIPLSRINKEMNLALESNYSWRFFEVLHACNGLSELFPNLDKNLYDGHSSSQTSVAIESLKNIYAYPSNSNVKFAALFLQVPESLTDIERNLNPNKSQLEMLKNSRELLDIFSSKVEVDKALEFFKRFHIWHQNGQYSQMEYVIRAQPNLLDIKEKLQKIKKAAMSISMSSFETSNLEGDMLGKKILEARLNAIKKILTG
tara:strand:+ start:12859 stop:13986 length:1128 start_codon:yes stop_codon:yes gene_type:complete